MSDKENCDSTVFMNPTDLLLKLSAGDLIHSPKRFIHQKDLRSRCQCSGNSDTLTLSTGQRSWITTCKYWIQSYLHQQFFRQLPTILPLPLVHTRNRRHIGNIFLYGHMRKQSHTLNSIADPTPQGNGICLRHVLSLNHHTPLIRRDQTIDQTEKCGFATAGATDDSHKLSRLNTQQKIPKNRLTGKCF